MKVLTFGMHFHKINSLVSLTHLYIYICIYVYIHIYLYSPLISFRTSLSVRQGLLCAPCLFFTGCLMHVKVICIVWIILDTAVVKWELNYLMYFEFIQCKTYTLVLYNIYLCTWMICALNGVLLLKYVFI